MNVLAINPWIYDFAAYDFWLKPYGFLVILEYLKNQGIQVDYRDCLDCKTTLANFGRGKYAYEIIEKPQAFSQLKRYYKRYGLPLKEFNQLLPDKKIDFILITSSMTYWYPGIQQVINLVKIKYPQTPIILGGTYATLCPKHAHKTSGSDFVFTNAQLADFFTLLKIPFDPAKLYATLPDYNAFYNHLDYVVLRTSWGCPFSCSYCAIKKLFNVSCRITETQALTFIEKYLNQGIKDFVFYDDAFLTDQMFVKNFLREICKLNKAVRFHTPNALHLRYLDEEIAHLLKQAGFINPHFGLETADPNQQYQWGNKVNQTDLINGINHLKNAGFKPQEFSVYLLLGYPGQNLKQLKEEIDYLHNLGAKISLAEFSPVPGTKIFAQYQNRFNEPLLQNNSVFGANTQEKIEEFWQIKNYLRQLNKSTI